MELEDRGELSAENLAFRIATNLGKRNLSDEWQEAYDITGAVWEQLQAASDPSAPADFRPTVRELVCAAP